MRAINEVESDDLRKSEMHKILVGFLQEKRPGKDGC
jgi:hypothetical protein